MSQPDPAHPSARVGASSPERSVLSGRAAYALVVGIIGLGLFASVAPSPLYALYGRLWHLSAVTLTAIYATYAGGILATLLVAGRISDRVGRRPVLLASLATLALSTALFMIGRSAAWLFVARALQGLATGAALSTASAALMDLHPRRDGNALPTGRALFPRRGRSGRGALGRAARAGLGFAGLSFL